MRSLVPMKLKNFIGLQQKLQLSTNIITSLFRLQQRFCKQRVPNRFFGIRDLAYFKAGIRDFEGKGGRDSGFNFHRDTGLDDFNRRESGNVALKKRRFGIPETEICKDNQAVNLAHLINIRNS